MDSTAAMANKVELDDLHVDVGERSVSRNGDTLPVTARSFELLHLLIASHPRIASTREIVAGVWPGRVVSSDALTQRVKLLRRQLGGKPSRYIRSVHGLGYLLAAAPKPCRAQQRKNDSAAPVRRHWAAQHPLLAAVLATTVAVAVLAGGVLVYDAPHALKHALRHRVWDAKAH